jgi:hypothetical protein
MNWMRPYEVLLEMCIAIWLFDTVSRVLSGHRIQH